MRVTEEGAYVMLNIQTNLEMALRLVKAKNDPMATVFCQNAMNSLATLMRSAVVDGVKMGEESNKPKSPTEGMARQSTEYGPLTDDDDEETDDETEDEAAPSSPRVYSEAENHWENLP